MLSPRSPGAGTRSPAPSNSTTSTNSSAPTVFLLNYSNETYTCKLGANVSAPGALFLTIPLTELNTTGEIRPEAAFDYGQVLGLSYLFYEAQRSGKLPSTNRIPWRGDSHLDDPVPGGYYDAGDTIKVVYPMSTALAFVAWGLIEFPAGHDTASQTTFAQDMLRWGADFLMACHTAPNTFVGQIADPDVDHALWERPEDDTSKRPAYTWTDSTPASDLFGVAAAALASISIALKAVDAAYSASCLSHAKQLYMLGTGKEGRYSDVVPQAYVYTSSQYLDKLAWAATWLYKADGDQTYMADAVNYYGRGASGRSLTVSWDNVVYAIDVLQATLPGQTDTSYLTNAQQFVAAWASGSNGITYSPKGLAETGGGWGTLRYTANAAMIGMILSKYTTDAAKQTAYQNWAQSQIDYLLGLDGRSFVVGFGTNPPTHEHHRGASCPISGPCGFDYYNTPNANPNILNGAIVGGPSLGDTYTDDRTNYMVNEVAMDYNAGFTAALAGLAQALQSGPQTVATPAPTPGASAAPPAATPAPTPAATSSPPTSTPAPPSAPSTPAPTAASASNCAFTVGPYGQCGGISNCQPSVCTDGEWSGACLPAGYSCSKASVWFYQAVPS